MTCSVPDSLRRSTPFHFKRDDRPDSKISVPFFSPGKSRGTEANLRAMLVLQAAGQDQARRRSSRLTQRQGK